MDEHLRHPEHAGEHSPEGPQQVLGFSLQREYNGVLFAVSSRFVIADLSPLTFFHLVERIKKDDVEGSILRLYERLAPLLRCRHEWTALRRSSDGHLRNLGTFRVAGVCGPYICTQCTAYALSGVLPIVGRDFREG